MNTYSGLLISGGSPTSRVGQSVEVFVPSTGDHCHLQELEDRRYGHSIEDTTEGLVACGGGDQDVGTWKSCLSLADGTWKATTMLHKQRLS